MVIKIIFTLVLLITAAIALAYSHSSAHKKFWSSGNSEYWDMEKAAKDNKQESWLKRTILAFTTDGWHLMNWIFNRCWQLAIAIWTPYPLIFLIASSVIFSGVFEQAYRRIKQPPWKRKKSHTIED